MKHKKFSKNNKIDIARMSRDDREQLMANLTIAELENKGKIGNYLLYYLLTRISKSNVFLDELFPEELFSDRELFSDAKSLLSEAFVSQNQRRGRTLRTMGRLDYRTSTRKLLGQV